MVTNQYQVRLVWTPEKSNYKDSLPETAWLTMVVGSSSQIPEGFSYVGDLCRWRAFPGQAVNDNGEWIDNEFAWFNLTNGNSQFIFTGKGVKANIHESISFPVGNQMDCPSESPANYGVIVFNEQTPSPWEQELNNDSRTTDWTTPPEQCPDTPPAGYSYVYQGRTVVVDRVTVDCTLPGLSDPVNPRDYEDSPTDVTLLHSTSTVSDMTCTNDVIVAHTWKLVPNK
jgi:hypothetical protein